MSMHKIPLTELEEEGLRKHGLDIGKPSQLSDAFRLGIKWASEELGEQNKVLQAEIESLRAENSQFKLKEKFAQSDKNKQQILFEAESNKMRRLAEVRYHTILGLKEQLTLALASLESAKKKDDLLKELLVVFKEKYVNFLKEQDVEAEEHEVVEGDMYGWNFHKGMRSGACQMHLDLTSLIRTIKQPLV